MRLSGRTIGWLLVSGVCLMASPLLKSLLEVGLGIDGVLAVLLITDALLLRQLRAVSGRRDHEEILSLGAANPVTLHVENPTVIPLYVALRDFPPDQCVSEHTVEAGHLNARGARTFSYHLTPLQRGEFTFGCR